MFGDGGGSLRVRETYRIGAVKQQAALFLNARDLGPKGVICLRTLVGFEVDASMLQNHAKRDILQLLQGQPAFQEQIGHRGREFLMVYKAIEDCLQYSSSEPDLERNRCEDKGGIGVFWKQSACPRWTPKTGQ